MNDALVPLVELRGVTKQFGQRVAVDQVDLLLAGGQIHALLGENGAGKSSLMCLLAGLYAPDAGQILIAGQPVRFSNPRDAMAASIGMVHQQFMLIPSLTVAENVLLGATHIPARLRPRLLAEQVQRTADRLGLQVDARAQTGQLSVGEQQRVEILRVLSRGAKVMILDEPTAVLAPAEIAALFATLRQLSAEGCAVVLISHKLKEVREVAHQLTVMRKGRVVARIDQPRAVAEEALAEAMVGHRVSLQLQRPAVSPGAVLFEARQISVRSWQGVDVVRRVNLCLREHEILGLAAVAGNGQRELLEALAGLHPLVEGHVLLEGQEITRAAPQKRVALGLRFIPEDRHHTGTAPSLSVAENLMLRDYRRLRCRRGPWLQLQAMSRHCQEKVDSLQIATTSLQQSARLLSGGNLQKVVLARELTDEARLILALYPTRGLDAWATAEVHRHMLAARSRRTAIVLCSEDLEEIVALADRIMVMNRGQIVYETTHEHADIVDIGHWMTTSSEEAGAQ